jgi:glycosyltransferase involved in cell wall biosynthesis
VNQVSALIVIQPSVSHYREPMIKRLRSDRRANVTLMGKYDSPEGKRDSRERVQPASEDTRRYVNELVPHRLFGPFTWESGILLKSLSCDFDVVVLEGRIFTLSTWAALLVRRMLGRRTLLWGHGWRTRDTGLKKHVRHAFYSLSAGLLLYGEHARLLGEEQGFPASRLHVIGNSIYDRSRLEALEPSPAPDAAHPLTLLCVSRLTLRRDLQLLIQAAAELRTRSVPIRVILVGEGAARSELEVLARRLGAPVEFAGAVYDHDALRNLYREAHLTVIPGAAGLTIIHSLGFGRPVIISDASHVHGPEFEAVRDGRNGLRFKAGSVESLVETIIEAGGWYERRPQLTKECLDSILPRYTAEEHASRLLSAVVAAASPTHPGIG